jgi:hypothetical protein
MVAGAGIAAIPRFLERRGWIAALLMCVPAVLPALLPGWYEGHDDLHIPRLIEYGAALGDGQIPPRWFPDVSGGLGSPHPLYYAPLFYALALVFEGLGLGLVGALKASIVVFMLLAAVGMYRYARLFFSPAAALVGAAAYTYAPYHLLDLYVRKAFSELTVFAVLPFLLEAFHRLRFRGSRWDTIAGAGWLAAFSTAHTISTMIAPPLLASYAVLLSRLPDPAPGPGRPAANSGWSWRWIPRAGLAVALGFMLAGFFVVPAFLERNAINLRMYTEAYVDYHKHFVYPQQLIWWPWGFGMSKAGLEDTMSFRMGIPQIAAILLAALGWRRLAARGPRFHTIFFLAVAAVSVFMMLPISVPFWELLPSLKFVQFPWRFLLLATVASGVLAAAAFSAWFPQPRRNASAGSAGWAVGLCLMMAGGAAAGGLFAVHRRIPIDRLGYEQKPFAKLIDRGAGAAPLPLDRELVRTSTLHWIDHLPPDVSYLGLTPDDLRRPKAEVVSGTARISDIRSLTWRHRFHVEAEGGARLRVNVYRLPGWIVRIDGTEAPLVSGPARERPVLFFDVPPGSHEVDAVLGETGPRRAGDGLTLAGLGGLALVALLPGRKGRDAAPGHPGPARDVATRRTSR